MFATTVLTLRGPTFTAVLALLKAKGDARTLEAVVDEALDATLVGLGSCCTVTTSCATTSLI